jgi:hypothetical protein
VHFCQNGVRYKHTTTHVVALAVLEDDDREIFTVFVVLKISLFSETSTKADVVSTSATSVLSNE